MANQGNFFWKRSPFVKLLLFLAAGILLQWYHPLPSSWMILSMITGTAGLLSFFFIPVFERYRYSALSGVCTALVFLSLGALLVHTNDIRNDPDWFGRHYKEQDGLLVTLDEPATEKPGSYKVNATAAYLVREGTPIPVKGTITCYFKKDPSLKLEYGRQVLFRKPLQEIRNTGNPGAFDYKRYCLFRGITHQVYLQTGEFVLLPGTKANGFRRFLFSSREELVRILQQFIPGKKESGLAEALLIGYKNDLDPSLVQAYARTGVVHIIAISGLHLGLIYWLLGLLLLPLKKNKKIGWLRPLLIICGLWLFSLLAGAQASILRSALMFTCIVCADAWGRKSSRYNTLAFSALVILCINPFWLWDTGFQLSYTAVLSILLFMQPVYHWFYIKNKALDLLWKLNAVTLSAQVLTLPVTVYYFHQFPNFFLLTNLLAVPLSSIILLGEILLCGLSFFPAIAHLTGRLLSWLIGWMNRFIESVDQIPFSRWNGLFISLPQVFLLFLIVAGCSYWLFERSVRGLQWGLLGLCGFLCLRSGSFIEKEQQQEIIVYNVPRQPAMDLVYGRQYYFIGDSSLQTNAVARNYHLEPARIANRVSPADQLPGLHIQDRYVQFGSIKMIRLDTALYYPPVNDPPVIDLLLLSGNPKLYMKKLAAGLVIRKVVIDGSVPSWKARYWKKDLDSLHIPWHDVSEQGAFVMKLN